MKTINLTLLLAASFICHVGPPALAASIQEIERLPFTRAAPVQAGAPKSKFLSV
jgi:hypothetical protein